MYTGQAVHERAAKQVDWVVSTRLRFHRNDPVYNQGVLLQLLVHTHNDCQLNGGFRFTDLTLMSVAFLKFHTF